MTRAELLVDLATRDGIESLVGDPVDVTPSGDVGVVAWYDQTVWEVRGEAALKKSIRFYVRDEGEAGEVAWYKDAEPQSDAEVRQNALRTWMVGVVDGNANDYKHIQIHSVMERWEMVVYSILEDDGATGLEWNTYYVRRGEGAPVKISNHDPSFLKSIFRV